MNERPAGARSRKESLQGGFTLIELLMSLFIASMVVGGLAGISALAARTQARDYRHGVVSNNLNLGMKYLESDLYQTLWVEVPSVAAETPSVPSQSVNQLCLHYCIPGSTNASFCKAANFLSDPTSGVGMDTVYYCWAPSATQTGGPYTVGNIYRYDDTTTSGLTCTSMSARCGTGNYEIVSINVDSMTFTRPPEDGNGHFYTNALDAQINGSWYSAATGTSDNVQLETQFTWYSPWQTGP